MDSPWIYYHLKHLTGPLLQCWKSKKMVLKINPDLYSLCFNKVQIFSTCLWNVKQPKVKYLNLVLLLLSLVPSTSTPDKKIKKINHIFYIQYTPTVVLCNPTSALCNLPFVVCNPTFVLLEYYLPVSLSWRFCPFTDSCSTGVSPGINSYSVSGPKISCQHRAVGTMLFSAYFFDIVKFFYNLDFYEI